MPSLLFHAHCQLGENPLWDQSNGCLYWTDVIAGRVHRYSPASRQHEVIYHGEMVGGFTLQDDGSLLLFRVSDIALLRADGEVESCLPFVDAGSERFNDIIADPEGRVFAGTIGKTPTSGGLFRVDLDGSITPLLRGSGVANGMGFSPDLRSFYWTCSTRKKIFVYNYDRLTGTLDNERVWYEATSDEGIPDGLAVDEGGHVWSARWDGSAVAHHAPDGTLLECIPLPARNVTSVCFGGTGRREMFITTAAGEARDAGLAGAVFRHEVRVPGMAEFTSRIGAECAATA